MASQRSQRVVVADLDLGLSQFYKDVEKLSGSYVKVGFLEGSKTHDENKNGRHKKGGLSMPQIAATNEFGTDRIPARPFISTAVDENRTKLSNAISNEYDKILEGKRTVEKSLSLLGIAMVDMIKKKIRSIYSPPNARSTIKKKGSSKPLIDFGQMIQSVHYALVIKK